LIVFYIFKDTEKNKLFNAITIPAVKERWMGIKMDNKW
jgi:hypothetical protein